MDKVVNFIDRHIVSFVLLPLYYSIFYFCLSYVTTDTETNEHVPDYGVGLIISFFIATIVAAVIFIRMNIKKGYSTKEYLVTAALIFGPLIILNIYRYT